MSLRTRCLIGLAALVVALAAIWVPTSFGASSAPARLGLTPLGQPGLYFDLTLTAGETRQLKVQVANFGSDEVLARTYAADVYSIVNGGFGAQLFGAQRSGATRWLDYPSQELRLQAGGGVVVDFQVGVPVGTPPGQYVTSLVAENVEPFQDDGGSVALKQINRVAIAVAIDIPGPRDAALEIGAVSYKFAGGVSFVSFVVENPGNVHLKPAGQLILRDSHRTELVRTRVTMDSVYAGTGTRLEVPLPEPLQPGAYCAEVRLTDPVTKASDGTSCLPFTVAPATQAGGLGSARSSPVPIVQPAIHSGAELLLEAIATLLVVAAFLLLLRRRRRQHAGMPPQA